jgi:hypothetical protein
MQSVQLPPHDAVAVAAYFHWLEAGRPSGRDQEIWLKAEAQLRKTFAPQGAAKVTCPEANPADQSLEPAGRSSAVSSRKVSGRKGIR